MAPEPSTVARRSTHPPKGEGQWALGYTEPLNPNERFKKDDDGLNVRARIETIYSRRGFASIDPSDLRGRMRWWGLYTQRKPGIDGGRTGSLEPHELDDEYFMLRVRSDGGILTPDQLRAIADVSQTYARDTADITDRQNVQLHWIRIEDVLAIWEKLESVGLTTNEACGDTPRVVLGSPVAGVAADEILDGTPAVREIVRRYIGDPRFSNLPRKFKSAVSGSPRQDVAHEINDVSFVGVVHPEHGPGFDVYVGGGLSTNPMLAQRLGVWVPLEEVPDVWEAVISVFRDYGYRRLRTRARLKFLVNDWGVAKLREVIETQYLKRPLLDGAAAPAYPGRRDHVGVYDQADGLETLPDRRDVLDADPVQLDVLPVGDVGGVARVGLRDVGDRAQLVRREDAAVAADTEQEVLVVELVRLERPGATAVDAGLALGVEAPPAHPAAQVARVDRREALAGVHVLDARADVEPVVVTLERLVGVERLGLAERPLALVLGRTGAGARCGRARLGGHGVAPQGRTNRPPREEGARRCRRTRMPGRRRSSGCCAGQRDVRSAAGLTQRAVDAHVVDVTSNHEAGVRGHGPRVRVPSPPGQSGTTM